MSSQMTYQEALSCELNARAQEAAQPALTEAAARMERFARCLAQAREKIRAGKTIEALHAHEVEALQDAAEFDNITIKALIAALSK